MSYQLLFYVYLLLNCGPSLSSDSNYNWTFMRRLQELCPYTSFCEENATMSFPTSNTKRPCCESCSCKPDCEKYKNCCFRKADTSRKCMAATVNTNITGIHYLMIHSCLINQHVAENRTMCSYDTKDYKSFAPVVSEESKDIFVNSECALCNNVNDTIPWKLVVYGLANKDFELSHDVVKLLNGEDVNYAGCYLGYVPPKHLNLESQECRNDVIHECNVKQKALEWEPLWDYCPMFEAPFLTLNHVYGNIFCFLCNEGYTYAVVSTCLNWEHKNPSSVAFTAILDVVDSIELESQKVPNEGVCGPTETLVHSIQTECRRVECSSGKIRHGGKCKFYSKEWIGGPFTVVLKLIPFDRTTKLDISNVRYEFKHGKKSSLLKRKAMKNWIVKTLLCRPSVDKKYVEYFVFISHFPLSTVNPSRLWTTLQRTLTETWLLTIKNTTVPLQVQLNKHTHYQMTHKNVLQTKGVFIDQEYGYLNSYSLHKEHEDNYLLEVYNIEYHYPQEPKYLNELFMCDQIKLLPEEFEVKTDSIVLKPENEVLFEAEFTQSWPHWYYVCLDRFRLNKGLSNVHYVQVEMIYVYGFMFIFITKYCTNGLNIDLSMKS